MSDRPRFYLTTAIAYANNAPGLHTVYEVIGADVIARWHRMLGDDTRFLTGTDEHSVNIAQHPVPARDDVCADHLVHGMDARGVVRVRDRGRQVEARAVGHGRPMVASAAGQPPGIAARAASSTASHRALDAASWTLPDDGR